MVDTEVLLDTGATTLSIVTAAELSFQPNRSEREAKRPPTAPTKQYDFITAKIGPTGIRGSRTVPILAVGNCLGVPQEKGRPRCLRKNN
ncbi:unnamed protein product [Tenebrio molitor]|nr:unnamed protein product [Tenebrio molitor]